MFLTRNREEHDMPQRRIPSIKGPYIILLDRVDFEGIGTSGGSLDCNPSEALLL